MRNFLSILWIVFMTNAVVFGQKVVSKDTVLMGSAFSFSAVSSSPEKSWNAIVAGIEEVGRIERLISSWKKGSETNLINENAGIKPVKVSRELFDLIFRANKVSELSQGYFDISFASLDKVWKFDGSEIEIPSDEKVKQSVAKINYKNIVLDREKTTVFLKEKGMKIGFGAIGKGYAADKAKALMKSMGIESGVVNAGGDIASWGSRPNGKPWTIGIADPKQKGKILSWLNISDKAVVTSGNYEKYVTIKGKKYCHIIDPKTGWPVSGVSSVTIITQQAEVADALSTTVFVLGEEEGLRLINHLDGVECIIVNDNDELIYSQNIELNLIDNETKQ